MIGEVSVCVCVRACVYVRVYMYVRAYVCTCVCMLQICDLTLSFHKAKCSRLWGRPGFISRPSIFVYRVI